MQTCVERNHSQDEIETVMRQDPILRQKLPESETIIGEEIARCLLYLKNEQSSGIDIPELVNIVTATDFFLETGYVIRDSFLDEEKIDQIPAEKGLKFCVEYLFYILNPNEFKAAFPPNLSLAV